jgi:predicted transcriptional regulator
MGLHLPAIPRQDKAHGLDYIRLILDQQNLFPHATGLPSDARALPLRPFLAQIGIIGLQPDRLAEATGAAMAQVFRRLAALPEDAVGPVGLVICDASGTLVFRKPIDGFDMPRLAGACALWPLYQVMAQPQVPLRARVRQVGA